MKPSWSKALLGVILIPGAMIAAAIAIATLPPNQPSIAASFPTLSNASLDALTSLQPGFNWLGSSMVENPNDGFSQFEGFAAPNLVQLVDGTVFVLSPAVFAGHPLASSQIFNPASQQFSLTPGTPNNSYSNPVVVLLNDGTVLIAGGSSDSSGAEAEIYNPTTGAFTLTGSLNVARQQPMGALLQDGTVLIAGGVGTSSSGYPPALQSAEIYHPSQDGFLLTGSMTTGHANGTATVLPNGKVLIAGGDSLGYADGKTQNIAELYDPSTGTFSVTTDSSGKQTFMTEPREYHTASLLQNGTVLLAGGFCNSPCGYVTLNSSEIYNPATGIFTASGTMTAPRFDHTAALLQNGEVLVAGGLGSEANFTPPVASAELYDPNTGQFTSVGSMGAARADHAALALSGGTVLELGGFAVSSDGSVGPALAITDLYNPSSGQFTSLRTMVSARSNPLYVTLGGSSANAGKVLMLGSNAGGWGDTPVDDTGAELFNPATLTFSPAGSTNLSHSNGTATLLADNTVLIVGGGAEGNSNRCLSCADIYNPTSGVYSPTVAMAEARTYQTATLIEGAVVENGMVLVAGGDFVSSGQNGTTAELYDPARQGFFPTANNMAYAHWRDTATMLPNGKILIAGAVIESNGLQPTGNSDLYDPSTNKFTATGSMTDARVSHTATLLPNGEVLVAGGENGSAVLQSAELYNPATGAFTCVGGGSGFGCAPAMTIARENHSAVLLSGTGTPFDGDVLLVGGEGPSRSPVPLASAEVYNPSTQQFSPFPASMVSARWSHGMVLFPSGPLAGKLLVFGGYLDSTLSSAEVLVVPAATVTATASPSATPTSSSSSTATATQTATATATATSTATAAPTATKTASPAPTPTATATVAPTPTVTATPTPVATPGSLRVAPGAVRFPKTKIGKTARKPLTIVNTGRGTLTGTVGSLSAPFGVTGGSFDLAGHKRERVIVTFAPTSDTQPAPQTLTITSDDPAHPSVQITVTGAVKTPRR